jgi:hypothetical protein
MVKLLLLTAMLSASFMSGPSPSPSKAAGQTGASPMTVTCFKTGEQTSGMNKICYYDCLGSPAAITISAVALCPLSIQR